MFARAMTAGLIRTRPMAVLLAGAFALAGCGGGERQDADEPEGEYRLEVVDARFPERQSIAERSTLRIQVRNADDSTAPNVAVTVETEPKEKGAAPASFSQRVSDSRLADPNRPVWIVDDGPLGGTTAYTNTWALGALAPGKSAKFTWKVTAVRPGTHEVHYRIAAGLNGKAKAQGAGGDAAEGSFTVNVSRKPAQSTVDPETGEVIRNGGSDSGN
jgi:hypothetical protein